MNVFRLVLIAGIAAAAVAAFASQASDTAGDATKDPTYTQLKRLVGGVWHTTIGKMDVESRWMYGPDGASIIGETIVGTNTKAPFHMNARFGWDAAAKQVYYLDAHGLDTVYFGHGTVEGSDVLLKFKGLVGDPGSFVFRSTFTSENSYHATLTDAESGKKIEEFDWKRMK